MIFTERTARAFLFYMAILLYFNFHLLAFFWFLYGYCVFEDEDTFEDIGDHLTYGEAKYENKDNTVDVMFRRYTKSRSEKKIRKRNL